MNKLGFFALALGLAACGDNELVDEGTTPTVSGVFPAQAFSGRTVRVEISGDATTWGSDASVAFGAGITVGTVAVASPTAIFADITIDPAAAPGLRDVSVNSGGSFTLTQAFEIDAPVSISFQGKIAQGGIAAFTIKNLDTTVPFDTTSTQDASGNATFTNVAVTGPTGTTLEVGNVTPFEITGTILIDVDAAGSGALSVANGPTATAVTDTGADITIAARTATPLVAGQTANGTIANMFDTDLYTYTAGTGNTLESIIPTPGPASAPTYYPTIFLLPASGHWSDLIANDAVAINQFSTGSDTFFAVVWEGTPNPQFNPGDTGIGAYTLDSDAVSFASTGADTEPKNSTKLGATAAGTLPFELDGASLATVDDQDWIKITVAAGDVGKTLHAATGGSDTQTDTVIDICDTSTCDTDFSDSLAESSDLGFNDETVELKLKTAGTYYIVFSADSQFYVDTDRAYTGAIWIE